MAANTNTRRPKCTLLGNPRRGAAGAAKLVAATLLARAAALTLTVTWALATVPDPRMHADVPVATLIAGQLALGALTAAFGLACGLALRNLPAAIGTVLVIALGLRPAVGRRTRARILARQRRRPAPGAGRRGGAARLDRADATIALIRLTRTDA